MFEFTETITIDAPASAAWNVMIDLEGWWPPSNPEHESIERLDDRGIEVGARFGFERRSPGFRVWPTGRSLVLIHCRR